MLQDILKIRAAAMRKLAADSDYYGDSWDRPKYTAERPAGKTPVQQPQSQQRMVNGVVVTDRRLPDVQMQNTQTRIKDPTAARTSVMQTQQQNAQNAYAQDVVEKAVNGQGRRPMSLQLAEAFNTAASKEYQAYLERAYPGGHLEAYRNLIEDRTQPPDKNGNYPLKPEYAYNPIMRILKNKRMLPETAKEWEYQENRDKKDARQRPEELAKFQNTGQIFGLDIPRYNTGNLFNTVDASSWADPGNNSRSFFDQEQARIGKLIHTNLNLDNHPATTELLNEWQNLLSQYSTGALNTAKTLDDYNTARDSARAGELNSSMQTDQRLQSLALRVKNLIRSSIETKNPGRKVTPQQVDLIYNMYSRNPGTGYFIP